MIFWILVIVGIAIFFSTRWNKKLQEKNRHTDFSKVRKDKLDQKVKEHLLDD